MHLRTTKDSHKTRRPHAVRGLLMAGGLLALAGCANLGSVPANTPLSEVQAQFGPPTQTCVDKQGQDRVLWSQQPMGPYAWGGTVNAQGEVTGLTQVLTDEHFKVLNEGEWTPDDVLCEFGPPAKIDSVGLPNVRQTVWNYRYRQDHYWHSLMFVFFGHEGTHVTRFHPGPDPLYDRDVRMPGL